MKLLHVLVCALMVLSGSLMAYANEEGNTNDTAPRVGDVIEITDTGFVTAEDGVSGTVYVRVYAERPITVSYALELFASAASGTRILVERTPYPTPLTVGAFGEEMLRVPFTYPAERSGEHTLGIVFFDEYGAVLKRQDITTFMALPQTPSKLMLKLDTCSILVTEANTRNEYAPYHTPIVPRGAILQSICQIEYTHGGTLELIPRIETFASRNVWNGVFDQIFQPQNTLTFVDGEDRSVITTIPVPNEPGTYTTFITYVDGESIGYTYTVADKDGIAPSGTTQSYDEDTPNQPPLWIFVLLLLSAVGAVWYIYAQKGRGIGMHVILGLCFAAGSIFGGASIASADSTGFQLFHICGGAVCPQATTVYYNFSIPNTIDAGNELTVNMHISSDDAPQGFCPFVQYQVSDGSQWTGDQIPGCYTAGDFTGGLDLVHTVTVPASLTPGVHNFCISAGLNGYRVPETKCISYTVRASTLSCNWPGGFIPWGGGCGAFVGQVSVPGGSLYGTVHNTNDGYSGSADISCSTGGAWTSSRVVCTPNVCQGSMPANGAPWDDEESTNLPANTTVAWAYGASDSSRKCQFACAQGYTWNGSGCALPLPPQEPPQLPGSFNAQPQECGTGKIRLTWSSVPGVESYQVFRDGVKIYDAGGMTTMDTGLGAGVGYVYTVTTWDSATGFSSGSKSTNPALTIAPGACPLSNTPPDAYAGSDRTIILPITHTNPIGVSVTDNEDIPAILTKIWTLESAPQTANPSIQNGTTLAPNFTNLTVPGTYVFRLTVTDSGRLSNSDTMQVLVVSDCPSCSGGESDDVAISATSCLIGLNQSSCLNFVTWDWKVGLVSVPRIYHNEVLFAGGGEVQNKAKSGVLAFGDHTFSFRDGITVLESVRAQARCVPGLTWSGTRCESNANLEPAASLDAPNCTIPGGSSSCTASITWSTSNIASPSIRQNGTSFSSAPSSAGTLRTLSYGTHTFTIVDGTTERASDTATASCAQGSTWNNTVCTGNVSPAPLLTLTASPAIINPGQSSTLGWTVSGNADACWASGGWTGWKAYSGTRSEAATPNTTTTYELECWNVGVSSGKKSVTVTVTGSGGSSGEITNVTGCAIPLNGSSCQIRVSWNVVNGSNPVLTIPQASPAEAFGSIGSHQPFTVSYGQHTLTLKDNNTGTTYDTERVTVSCAAGTWNGTRCVEAGGGGSCTTQTVSHCEVTAQSHNGESGVCSTNYTGTCHYRCTNSSWTSIQPNTCTRIPTGNLYVNGSGGTVSITNGQSATLTWSTQNANTCEVGSIPPTQTWTGTSNMAGVLTNPITRNLTYVLTCDNRTIDAVSITVSGSGSGVAPTLTASEPIVTMGTPVTLSWNTNGPNENECSLVGGSITGYSPIPLSDNPTQGSLPTPVQGRTTYTITCNGISSSVTVLVKPRLYEQ